MPQALADVLTSPAWLLTLGLLLFLASHGSRWPWTRTGGAVLAVLTSGGLAIGLSEAWFRRAVLHPERLPVAVLILATGLLVWLEMHRSRRFDAEREAHDGERRPPEPSRGISTAEILVATGGVLGLIAAAAFAPVPLADAAGVSRSPAAQAPWFLAGLEELCFYFDPWVAYGAVPILLVAGLLGLPLLETQAIRPRTGRALFLFGWLFLGLWPMAVGVFLRGETAPAPGPGSIALEAWTLAQVVWVGSLHVLEPARWWLRELPGLAALAAYFGLLPWLLARWRLTRTPLTAYRDALGGWRFFAAAAWLMTASLVPLKMVTRWLWGVGYWIHLPEWSFHF